MDELGGERVDIVRWNESSQILIANSLKPAEINQTALCFEMGRATVVVNEDQLSLAIGKRGQNVRLAARLTGWDIDILTPAEYNAGLDRMVKTLRAVEGITDEMLDKMIALGMVSLLDVEEVGTETLVENCGMPAELAGRILAVAVEEAKKILVEQQANRERNDAARRQKEAQEADWARKMAAGEMSLDEVEKARAARAAEAMDRKAAAVGLSAGTVPVSLPEVAVPVGTGEGPLTLEQRLAISRQRESEQEAQAKLAAEAAPAAPAAPAESPAEPSAPAGGEEASKAGGSESAST